MVFLGIPAKPAINGTVAVRFEMAGNPDNTDKIKSLQVQLVALAGSQLFTFDATGKTKANMGWETRVAEFANVPAGNYGLVFTSSENNAYGAALDNVSMTVPDGGSTFLVLGGTLVALAGFRRVAVRA